jgi:preprotein translocase subunit SecD
MTKRGLTGVLLAFLLGVAVLWGAILVNGWGPNLGLDLQGGVSLTLEPTPGQGEIDEGILDQTVEVIRRRVDGLGVAEPEIARQGQNVIVQLPGVADQEQAEDVVGQTAALQFRRVLEEVVPGQPGYDDLPACDDVLAQVRSDGPPPADEDVVLCQPPNGDGDDFTAPADQWSKFRLGPVVVDGGSVEDARAVLDQTGFQWGTALDFDRAGEETFRQFTAELACEQGDLRRLAIILDGVVESAPPVAADVACGQGISGGGQISVGSQDEAEELALVLRSGALPIQFDFAQSQAVSPTLGSESLQAGLQAGLIGLVLVAGYLVVLYRGVGAVAVAELLMFGALVFGAIIVMGQTVGFTLTLAGIAGIIVSIGIAADSSIIYRERYRDEIRKGRTVRSAAEHAFSRAWRTNLTGNTVSFLAAVVLYVLAIGPVRGFAFTLGLSTLIDTFLFATFTRSVFGLTARSPKLARSTWMGLRADTFTAGPVTAATGGQTARQAAGRAGK